eukprot:TRINITY_DN5117_c0_g1_i2.p1 TRINITY_DN5117_c0_g1~~TRINITY_DN5117_c0_g1_i2.p1  ORF type:complete len:755 (+),score=120.70 TRINITY_DN5117_c0_g1_i2:120-2267(+)
MAAPEREHGIDDCAEDASLEIVHRKVSLLDPLSLSLIQDPVKGLRCDHIEAFDRQVYIQYHQHLEKRPFVPRRRLWICPHCDKVAWPKDLQPAEAFRELLVAARSSPGVWNAIVRVDGSFALADDPVVAPGSAGSQRPRCEQLGAGDEGRSGTVLTTDFAKDQSTQAPAAVQRMLACNGIADAAADNDKAHSPLAQVIEVEEGSDTECPHATVKNGGLASSTSPSLVAAKATGVKRKKPDRDGCTAGTYFGGGLLSRVQGHGDVRSTDTAQRSTGCDGCSGNTSATPPGPQGISRVTVIVPTTRRCCGAATVAVAREGTSSFSATKAENVSTTVPEKVLEAVAVSPFASTVPCASTSACTVTCDHAASSSASASFADGNCKKRPRSSPFVSQFPKWRCFSRPFRSEKARASRVDGSGGCVLGVAGDGYDALIARTVVEGSILSVSEGSAFNDEALPAQRPLEVSKSSSGLHMLMTSPSPAGSLPSRTEHLMEPAPTPVGQAFTFEVTSPTTLPLPSSKVRNASAAPALADPPAAANESMCNACGGLRRSQNGSDVGGRGVGGTIKLWLQSRPTRCSCVSVTEDEALEVQATTGVGAATASEGATPAEDEALEVQATTGVGAATASEGATPAEETAAVVAGPAVAAPSLSAAAAATAAWACGTRGKSEISSGSGGANAESVTVEHGKRGAAKNAFRTTSRGGASRGTRGRKAIGRI